MLLDTRLEGVLEVLGQHTSFSGRPYFETSLVSDDGQTLHVFEGHLKEQRQDALQVGKRYKVVFRPFINNRWLELKIERIEPCE